MTGGRRNADAVAEHGDVAELDPIGLEAANLGVRQDELAVVMAQAGRRFVDRVFGKGRGSRRKPAVGVVVGPGVGDQFVEITERCDMALQNARGCPAVVELLGDVGRAKALQ